MTASEVREIGIVVTELASFALILAVPLLLVFSGRRRPPFSVGRLGFRTREELVRELGALLGLAGTVPEGGPIAGAPERGAPERGAQDGPLGGLVFSGERDGRKVVLVLVTEDDGDSRLEQIARFELGLPRAPSLRVTRASVGARLKRFLSDAAGSPAAPLATDLAAEADPAATRALHGRLALLVETLFLRYPIRDLRLGGELLRADLPTRGLAGGSLRDFLEHLAELARVTAELCRGVRLRGTRAFGPETRCGYCHETFAASPPAGAPAADESSLVACELCATVLHEACRDEHGGCPVLGCTGRAEMPYRSPG